MENIYGIIFCFTIGLMAQLIIIVFPSMEVLGVPVLGMFMGMVSGHLFQKQTKFQPGIKIVSKKFLQYAVIFLGFGLNLKTIGEVGLESLPIIVSTITISLIVAFGISKIFKIDSITAVLIGVGSSICGGSAIATVAPIVKAKEKEIAQAISVIFIFNIIAALVFPSLGSALGMSNSGFSIFAGSAINDTSSVTAAASTWDTLQGTGGEVLAYATIIKLTRTLAIIPISIVLAYFELRKQQRDTPIKLKVTRLFPIFILYFMSASIITTLLTSTLSGHALALAHQSFSLFKILSKFLIVMAMSAIGFNTNLIQLFKEGGKPLLLGATCWISIILVCLSLQRFLNLY